jgi:hypothetical protein
VVGVSLFSMVAALGTVNDAALDSVPSHPVTSSSPCPALVAAADSNQSFLREERVQRGDTVMGLLQRLGVDDPAAAGFLKGSASTQSLFRQLSPGKNLTARTGPQGELQALVFPLNGGKDQALVVERKGDAFSASEQALPLETQVVMKSAEIRYSLFGASDAAGIPDSVATQLADIFGGDIDFHRDLRKGDRFAVIYESINYLGRPVRSGRILAAEFVNNGKILSCRLVCRSCRGRKQQRLLHGRRQEHPQGLPAVTAGVFSDHLGFQFSAFPSRSAEMAGTQGHRLRGPRGYAGQGHRQWHGRVRGGARGLRQSRRPAPPEVVSPRSTATFPASRPVCAKAAVSARAM